MDHTLGVEPSKWVLRYIIWCEHEEAKAYLAAGSV